MSLRKDVQKNPLGFDELVYKPTREQLEKFYQDQYFDSKNFEIKYSEEEYFHKNIPHLEAYEVSKLKKGKVLDIGCGEGFSLNFFHQKGWKVKGIDYSKDGVERHFPSQLANLIVGDIYEQLDSIQESGEKFDLIICNNVLEHLLDPVDFVKRFNLLLTEEGVARIQVPNDNSFLQQEAVRRGLAEEQFWVAPHEHMSYFTQESLKNLIGHCGLKTVALLGDFPIDFFLFNEDSNYLLNGTNGAGCHRARVRLDNLLGKTDPKKLVAFRKGCGEAGLGRNAIIYFSRE